MEGRFSRHEGRFRYAGQRRYMQYIIESPLGKEKFFLSGCYNLRLLIQRRTISRTVGDIDDDWRSGSAGPCPAEESEMCKQDFTGISFKLQKEIRLANCLLFQCKIVLQLMSQIIM